MDKRTFISKLENNKTSYLISILAFGVIFSLSKLFLKDLYVFNWAANQKYMYIWILVLLLIYHEKKLIAHFLVWGNVAGLLFGQIYGDILLTRSVAKIKPDMDSGTIYRLSCHQGAFIWAKVLIVSLVIGLLIEWYKKRIMKKKNKTP